MKPYGMRDRGHQVSRKFLAAKRRERNLGKRDTEVELFNFHMWPSWLEACDGCDWCNAVCGGGFNIFGEVVDACEGCDECSPQRSFSTPALVVKLQLGALQ